MIPLLSIPHNPDQFNDPNNLRLPSEKKLMKFLTVVAERYRYHIDDDTLVKEIAHDFADKIVGSNGLEFNVGANVEAYFQEKKFPENKIPINDVMVTNIIKDFAEALRESTKTPWERFMQNFSTERSPEHLPPPVHYYGIANTEKGASTDREREVREMTAYFDRHFVLNKGFEGYYRSKDVDAAIIEEFAGKPIDDARILEQVTTKLTEVVKQNGLITNGIEMRCMAHGYSMALKGYSRRKAATEPKSPSFRLLSSGTDDNEKSFYVTGPQFHMFPDEKSILKALKEDPRTSTLGPKFLKEIAKGLGNAQDVNDTKLSLYVMGFFDDTGPIDEFDSEERAHRKESIESVTDVLRDTAHTYCKVITDQDEFNYETIADRPPAELEGIWSSDKKLEENLEQEKLQPPEKVNKEVKKFLESRKPEAELAKKVAEAPVDPAHITAEVLKAAAGIAREIHTLLQERNQFRIRQSPYKALYKDYRSHRSAQREDLKEREMQHAYGSFEHIQQHVYNRLSPKGMVEMLEETRKLSEEYQQEMQLITQDMATNETLGKTIQEAQQFNDRLAKKDNARWRKAVRTQRRLGQKIGLARTIFGIAGIVAGTVIACLPGGQAPGAAIAAGSAQLLSVGGQFGQQAVDNETQKINGKYQKRLKETQERSDRLQRAAGLVQEQGFRLHERELQQQEILICYGSAFDPNTHVKLLGESLELQEKRLNEIKAKLEQAEQRYSASSGAASMDQARLKLLQNPHSQENPHNFVINFPGKKGWYRIDGCTKEQLEKNLADHQTNAVAASVEVNALKTETKALANNLKITQEEANKAGYLRPMKEAQKSVLEEAGMVKFDEEGNQVSVLSSEQEERKDKRDEFGKAVQLSLAKVAAQNQIYTEGLRVAHQYAWFLHQATGTQLPLQLASMGHDLVAIKKSRAVWKDIHNYVTTFYRSYGSQDARKTAGQLHETIPGEASNAMKLAFLAAEDLLPLFRLSFTMGSLLFKAWRVMNQPKTKGAIKSELEVYVDILRESTQFLREVIEHQVKGLSAQMNEQHRELYELIHRAELEVLQEIDAGNQRVLKGVEDSSYTEQVLRLEDKLGKLKRKPDPVQIREAIAPIHTGLIPGYVLNQEEHQLHRTIKPAIAFRNPEHFTGLLLSQFNLHRGVPNFAFLEAAISGLTELASKLPREEALKIQEMLFTAFIQTQQAFGKMDQALQQLQQRKQAFLEKIETSRSRMQTFQKAFIFAETNQVIKSSFSITDQLANEGFAGASKFYFSREVLAAKLSERISPMSLHEVEHLSLFGEGVVGKTARVGLFSMVLIPMTLWLKNNGSPYGAALVGGTFALNFLNNSYQANQLGSKKIPALEYIWTKSDEERAFASLWNVSLTDLHKTQEQQQLAPEPVLRSIKLVLDLKSKRIKRSSDHPSAGEIPLAYLDVSKKRLNVRFDIPNGMRKEHVDRIKVPGINKTDDEYNRLVKTMIQDYAAYLNQKVSPSALSDGQNKLEKELKGGVVIAPLNPGMIPLVFPKKLMKDLEAEIEQDRQVIEGLGVGTIAPAYDFSLKNGAWVLSIHYRVITPNQSMHSLCHFDMRSFDQKAVRSFERDLLAQEPTAPNEFLLQAMYGFPYGLGVTESVSELPNGLLTPHEKSSEFLYQTLEPTALVVDGGYHEVMKAVFHSTKAVKEELSGYENDYLALYGLVKLASTLPYSEFTRRMDSMGLYSPGIIHKLSHENLIADSSSGEEMRSFVQEIVAKPSEPLQRLQNAMKTLQEALEQPRT